jgi:hypothetical protein
VPTMKIHRLGWRFFPVILLGISAWLGNSIRTRPQASRATGVPLATEDRLKNPGWWPTKGTPPRNEYAGADACAKCHGSKFATQRFTPMARAAAKPADAEVLRTHNRLTFRLDGYSYEIARTENGSVYSVSDGTSSISQPLSWAFGIGEVGQTYIFEKNETFHESRVSFYPAAEGLLDLTLGHQPPLPNQLENAPGRAISTSEARLCFGCHTTASTTGNQFDVRHLFPGVGCEACHGPGAKHVAAMQGGHIEQGKRLTLNPARLKPVDSVDFCGACHRTSWDVVLGGLTGIANVRFQPYRLEKSRCWGKGDARITCIACHDPHLPLVRDAAAYDKQCLRCHLVKTTIKPALKATQTRPGAPCPVSDNKCVTCHMPKYELPGFHAKFTDHWIRIARPNAPYPD